jgi:hypothetical protein
VTVTADPALTQARDTLVRRRAAIDEAIKALDRVIESDTGPAPPSDPQPPSRPTSAETKPSLRHLAERRGARTDTAEAIITERPGVGVTPQELAEAMAERGVPLRSENLTRAARAVADRVRTRNPNVELENGRFVYRPPESPNGSATEATGRVRPEAFGQAADPQQEEHHE